jgi:signal peptidase II
MDGMRWSSTGRKIALLVLFVTTIGCDRVTKSYAESTLSGSARQSYLADTVRLEYTENPGGFLGFGADWPAPVRTGLFTVGTGAILLGMLIVLVRSPLSPPALVGAALFVAGGTSNLVDRLFRGSVVDFMNVGIGPVRTGIFNVADMALMLGLAVYFVTHLRSSGQDTTPPVEPPADATSAPSPDAGPEVR